MPRREVMWPRLIASKLLKKQVGRNNFVADFFPSSSETCDNKDDVLTHTHTQQLDKINCLNSHSILDDYHALEQHTQNYKVFVSTWNLGGVEPRKALDIDDLLDMCNHPCDIYVFGFQEVVPLKASSVLGSENSDITKQWNSIIRASLNKQQKQYWSVIKDNNNNPAEVAGAGGQFKCIVSKQMVGILITVWIRSELRSFVRDPSVSCVGCGIMGCLGNKGSVSVRFRLHETSFCFVCSHLASGCKGGDEKQRNSNAAEILSRTTFPKRDPPFHHPHLPTRILDHDRVVWLGDLNYRISLPESATRLLVDKQEWNALLQNDQLKTELMGGQVFEGWHEGTIEFAPTYKYNVDSDEYYGHGYLQTNKEKKRSPAWCDRIIWFGEELKQEMYARGESKLSDHRPVKSIFSTKVVTTKEKMMQKTAAYFLSERFLTTTTTRRSFHNIINDYDF